MTTTASERPLHGTFLLLLIVLLGVGLRLLHLDHWSLWGDESASIFFARMTLGDIWGADTMPPLYYSFLHHWRLAGEDEVWLRLSSVVFSAISLPLAYGLGKRIGGRALGLWLALALATAPFSLRYAQELRMYSLLELEAVLVFFALAGLLQDPARAARPLLRRGARLDWLLYALGSLLALYTHNTGVLLPMTACVLAVLAWWRRPERVRLARNWTVVNAIVLLLWAVYWPWLLEQAEWVAERFWVRTPGFWEFFGEMAEIHFSLGRQSTAMGYLAALPILLAMIGGLWLLARNRRSLAVAAAVVLFLPPAVELLLGFIRPIFLPRTLIWTGIAGALCLAVALQYLVAAWRDRRWQALAVGGVALLLLARGLVLTDYYASPLKADYRAAAELLNKRAAMVEPVIVSPYWEELTVDYYLARFDGTGTRAERPLIPLRSWRLEQTRGLVALAMPASSVWFVQHVRSRQPEDRAAFLRNLLPCATSVESHAFSDVVVERFDVAACADAPVRF